MTARGGQFQLSLPIGGDRPRGTHVTRSNSFDQLAEALFERLEADPVRGTDRLFATTPVVVPNRTVAQVLRLRLADRRGVAAGLEFSSFDEFLAGRVGASGRVRVLDREALQALLVGRLLDRAFLDQEALAPVRGYLAAAGDADAADVRRFQLAEHLARLFVEYAASRPSWGADRSAARPAKRFASAAAGWQRELWRAIFGPGGALDRAAWSTGVRRVLLARCLEVLAESELALPPEVHAVLAAPPPCAYWSILARLAAGSRFWLYLYDPAMGSSHEWARPDGAVFLAEMARLGATIGDRPGPRPAGDSLLARLSRDLLGEPPSGAAAEADPSIRILRCPGVQREVEAIAAHVWDAVRRVGPPPLAFHEIAVLLCGRKVEEYQAQIRSVFRDTHGIPFTLSDVPAAAESRILEAVHLLLALPFGNWTRPELLSLLTHPAVAARYPDVDPADWTRWCERLSIVYGADRLDLRDSYVERDLFHWDQGVRRLALGVFRSAREERPCVLSGEPYLAEPVEEDRIATAGAFGLLVRSLAADARWSRTAELPLGDWARFLVESLTTYLVAATDEDARLFERCVERVARLADLDVEGRPVPYRIAYEFARTRLEGLRTNRGVRYPEGVLVATAGSVRPLPFRVVFLAGLGEGEFPSADRLDALDLRAARREPWDVGLRDRDRDVFLDVVVSTRDRLYLSYVSREETTGDSLRPSHLVRDLLSLLERGHLGPEGAGAIHVDHPLRRHAEPRDLAVPPAARREELALALRRDLVGERPVRLEPEQVLEAVPPDRRGLVEEVLGLPAIPDAPPPGADAAGRLQVPLRALVRFLECPLQGSVAFHLRLDEPEEDLLLRTDEPFELAVPSLSPILRDVLLSARRDRTAPGPLLEAAALREELAGRWPTGIFSRIARARSLAAIDTWNRSLAQVGVAPDEPFRLLQFGRAVEEAAVEQSLPPLVVPVDWSADRGERRAVEVELHGLTQPQRIGSPGAISFGFGREPDPKHFLRGFLDHVCLAAAGRRLDRPYAVTVATFGTCRVRRYLPLEPSAATAWLGTVLADLLSGVHAYVLPIQAVQKSHDSRGYFSPAHQARKLLAWSESPHSSKYGPIPARRLEDFEPPDDALAARIVERRYRLFLEGWIA